MGPRLGAWVEMIRFETIFGFNMTLLNMTVRVCANRPAKSAFDCVTFRNTVAG